MGGAATMAPLGYPVGSAAIVLSNRVELTGEGQGVGVFFLLRCQLGFFHVCVAVL